MISEKGAKYLGKAKLPKNSVMVSCIATVGNVAITSRESFTNQQINSVIPNIKIIDPLYLYYFFKNNKEYIESLGGGGSVYTNISKSKFENMPVVVPELTEQKRIAKILGALDEKIELNRRMNDTLEKIANAIFKHWFVDFDFPNKQGKPYKSTGGKMIESELGLIPNEWSVGKLGDELKIVMGQSPSGSSYNENGDGLPFYQGRTDFGYRFPQRRIYCSAPTRIAEPLDTLISVRAPVGDINMASEKCCIGRGVGAIRKEKFSSYVFYKLKSLQNEIKQFDSEGTVFGSINKDSLSGIATVIPDDKTLDIFEKNVSIVDNEIFNLSKEIDNLSQIRDSLLPRLMSGKIRINV
jgi:type I restriction enzyme S subunit